MLIWIRVLTDYFSKLQHKFLCRSEEERLLVRLLSTVGVMGAIERERYVVLARITRFSIGRKGGGFCDDFLDYTKCR